MSDELAMVITCDVSSLTSAMTESRDQLDQTITTIQRQETSWGSLATTTIEALAKVAGPIISLVAAQKKLAAATMGMGAANALATPPTLTFAAAVNFLLSPIVLVSAAVVLLGAAIWYFTSGTDEAAATTKKLGGAAKDTASDLSFLGQIQDSFSAGLIGAEGVLSLQELREQADETRQAFNGFVDVIQKPFKDAGFEVGDLVEKFTGFNQKVQLITSGLKLFQGGMEAVTEKTKAGIASLTLFSVMATTGVDANAAGEIIAQREVQRKLELELYQGTKAQIFAEEELSSLMKAATSGAEQRGEISRIASVTSLEGIEAEITALEEYISTSKLRGNYDKEAQKDAADRAKAIANQQEGIASGKVKEKETPADAMIAAAKRALATSVSGKDQSQIDALKDKNGTPAQVEELKSLLAQQNLVNSAKEAAKKAIDDLNKSMEDAAAKNKQGADKIASLKDQIDQLNGSATKAEITMRQLGREGFNKKQSGEIGKLTEELDKLKEKNDKGKSQKTDLKAAFAGTQEAASIMLRGLGSSPAESEAKKQTGVLNNLLQATKANKPQELQPVSLGT